jgi:hypothetical protein
VLLVLIAKECYRQHAYLLTQRISLQAWNTKKVIAQNPVEIYCFVRAWVSFFAYAPGPDLASNAVAFKMSMRNNTTIISYSR